METGRVFPMEAALVSPKLPNAGLVSGANCLNRLWPLATALALTTACSPAETTSSVIVSQVDANTFLARTNDNLSPGDAVRIWRRHCVLPQGRHMGGCRYREIAEGVVTTMVLDSPVYAFVRVAPNSPVELGDRATKDSPGTYWHPRSPSD